MLGEVVGLIGFSGLPVDDELALFNLVAHPVEMHVHGSGLAFLNCDVGNAFSAFIVCLYGGGRLRMTKFFECDTDDAGILRDVEQGSELSFGRG
jgi:hypothetical protein